MSHRLLPATVILVTFITLVGGGFVFASGHVRAQHDHADLEASPVIDASAANVGDVEAAADGATVDNSILQTKMGTAITYQGRLDDGGAPANGTYDLQFAVFPAADTGANISTVTKEDVAVANGMFTVILDFGHGVFRGDQRWIEIRARDGASSGAYDTLSPRHEFTPAPYALALPAMRIHQNDPSPSVIGGYYQNWVNSSVSGATIGGGGKPDSTNSVTAHYGTVGGGYSNAVSGENACIGGGFSNVASGTTVVIGGGESNQAIATRSTVAGGYRNVASGENAFVGGGDGNEASGLSAVVAGGGGLIPELGEPDVLIWANHASGDFSTIGGGAVNMAWGRGDTIGGGLMHEASAEVSTISGGFRNQASGAAATVGGGRFITATGSASTIGGGEHNAVWPGFEGQSDALGATVSGGQQNHAYFSHTTIGGGAWNSAGGYASTIAGGGGTTIDTSGEVVLGNATIGSWASIGGGGDNFVNGLAATISGGMENEASGAYASIPGGLKNEAAGDYSFAAGHDAHATHDGAFVWCDDYGLGGCISEQENEFHARAAGGFRFLTGMTEGWSGVRVRPGASSWESISDREAKENFEAVDGRAVLERLAEIPITTWNYKTEIGEVRHIGPMAQDFHTAFGVGADDKHISTIDPDGVALAAIQGLHADAAEKDARIGGLEAEVAALQASNADLAARVATLEGGAHDADERRSAPWRLGAIELLAGALLLGAVAVGRGR